MPADEKTRLRIRQYLTELIDEEAADAMMESMPPIAWTELATKADISRLDGRLDSVSLRVDQNSSDIQELTRTVAAQGTLLGARIDGLSDRIDAQGERLDQRIDGVSERLDHRITELGERLDQRITEQGERLDQRIDGVSGRLDGLSERMDSVSLRMDSIGTRMDDIGVQMGQLGRAVTVGAATMAITLAVFMIGTIASLIAAGAFG